MKGKIMGYVPPPNQRGNDVGVLKDDDQWPPFWTPSLITVAILALCLFSYGIGLWHGQMQGLRIAEAMQQAEKPRP